MIQNRGKWLVLVLSLGAAGPAGAAPPRLQEAADAVPRQARTGEKYTFRVQYTDPDGDRPQEARLVTEGPEGRHPWPVQPFQASAAQYQSGVTLEFVAGPFDSGDHHARFEVTSIDGSARFPASGSGLPFSVENVLLKWVELVIGLAVALLFLPLIMFVLVRAANPRSDPSRAARFGLLVGIVASYALFVYLFSALYPLPWMLVLGVLALGALFALVPRRV